MSHGLTTVCRMIQCPVDAAAIASVANCNDHFISMTRAACGSPLWGQPGNMQIGPAFATHHCRLCTADALTSASALRTLVSAGFLRPMENGSYGRTDVFVSPRVP